MDTVYPQPIRLRLDRSSRRKRGTESRYRTQPITFSEIKEVDEETADEEPDTSRRMSAESPQVLSSKSTSNVNAKFEELFHRKRTEKRIPRRLQNRLDLSMKPSISIIPGSPENGIQSEDSLMLPKIPSKSEAANRGSD